MGIESGPGGYQEQVERIELPYSDETIARCFGDEALEAQLREADPVTWLRGSMTVGTERSPAEVTDKELLRRYVGGGKFEWDPTVAQAVAQYLKDRGFQWSP